MARASNGPGLIPLAAALALAGLSTSCTAIGDPVGFSIASQDKYDFMTCKEIIDNRNAQRNRMKDLAGLIEKADSAPGGFLISAGVYRSDYVQTRALLQAAERAAQLKDCDTKKP